MKTSSWLAAALLFILSLSARPAQAQVEVSFQVFYDELSPYGQWVDYPDYGYVWIPAEEAGFAPYSTYGHWVFTDLGWTWVSDYTWGWAPFHYGRWYYDAFYGWVWIPGMEWAPAWAAWRYCPGYYGWAPMGPGVDVNVVVQNNYYGPREHWTFVEEQYVGDPNVTEHVVPQSERGPLLEKSTVVKDIHVDEQRHSTYLAGPDKNTVAKAGGTVPKQVSIKESDAPGQSLKGNELHLYRPIVNAHHIGQPAPAPVKVTPLNEVKQRGNKENIRVMPENKQPVKSKEEPVQKDVPKNVPQQTAPPQQNPPPVKQMPQPPPPKQMPPQPRQMPPPQQAPKTMPQPRQIPQPHVTPRPNLPTPKQVPRPKK